MKVISIIAQKGGVGKSTLSAHLSVELSRDGSKVVGFDLDRQASFAKWLEQRGDRAPTVIKVPVAELDKYLRAARDDAVDIVLIDTPPHAGVQLNRLANITDLALIPLRPAFFDLASLAETGEFVKKTRHLVILNQVAAVGRDEIEAREVLAREFPDLTVARASLKMRKAYAAALILGAGVAEIERPGSKASAEIQRLVSEIREHLA
jgi:chromosome partitioning protein